MKQYKYPNFFLIGAPKSGTTSLAYYLAQHKNVFFSTPKEPWFFSAPEFTGPFSTYEEYLNLFSGVNSNHKAVGEGSVFYLYSSHAVADILERFPSAKFIVMLRNPVDASFSAFVQSKKSVNKVARDQFKTFKEAWYAQNDRARGLYIPKGNGAPEKFQYGKIFSYHHQLKRLFNLVNRDNVHIIIFDDLKSDTKKVYKNVLSFLGLPFQEINSYEAKNTMAVINDNNFLKKMLMELLSIGYNFKRKIGIHKSFAIISKFYNSKNIKIEKPDPEFRHELIEYFKEDIEKTEILIGKDLSAWKK